MTAQHTPGPWSLGTVTTKSGRNKLALRAPSHRICDISVYDNVDEANARLIAAAPELLAALRVVLAYSDSVTDGEGRGAFSWAKVARAAIAKAEGRS